MGGCKFINGRWYERRQANRSRTSQVSLFDSARARSEDFDAARGVAPITKISMPPAPRPTKRIPRRNAFEKEHELLLLQWDVRRTSSDFSDEDGGSMNSWWRSLVTDKDAFPHSVGDPSGGFPSVLNLDDSCSDTESETRSLSFSSLMGDERNISSPRGQDGSSNFLACCMRR